MGYLSLVAFERQFYEKTLAVCVRSYPLLTTDLKHWVSSQTVSPATKGY
ncbi:hypothetical protein NTGHW29_150074 [Candidatus Nitrotoga sp. HW29]|nr:hypothetical protein NTGHW29_150074 [Candidatus Nitrotoga sp. HW29]